MEVFKSQHISVTILCPPGNVYLFASNPENLPRWAAGLADASIEKVGANWVTDSPMGQIKIKFAEPNLLGVMDHDVTLSSGAIVHNPFRVLKNGKGSEVVFTLFRQPQMTDDEFRKDADMVNKDLLKLKFLLEKT